MYSPSSEIRSAPPIRTTVANNIIYNTERDEKPVINHSNMEGILFKNNLIDNNGNEYSEYNVLQNSLIRMKKINEWLYAPENPKETTLSNVFEGYDFGKIQQDIFGTSRAENNSVGAISQLDLAEKFVINKNNYGPDWFSVEKITKQQKTLNASSTEGELAQKILQADDGDIIELMDSLYTIKTTLKINKEITLRPKGTKHRVKLIFSGEENTPAFEMNPNGNLKLKNLIINGENKKITFAPLKENMASAYNLSVVNCEIMNFEYVLKAYKGSFADSITIKKTTIENCENGIVLAADMRGDYNAEMVLIDECKFENVQNNVVNFFRDGYDESTIGGHITITNNSFTDCGKKEKSNILLKTRGIINVNITGNTFKNNPIELVARLWGEKNNHHANNIIINSGEIIVEEQQKLKILY